MRKGVFSYEYIDCVEKLEELCLPPRESFYNSLMNDTVSENTYAHAVNVWKQFFIRILGEATYIWKQMFCCSKILQQLRYEL